MRTNTRSCRRCCSCTKFPSVGCSCSRVCRRESDVCINTYWICSNVCVNGRNWIWFDRNSYSCRFRTSKIRCYHHCIWPIVCGRIATCNGWILNTARKTIWSSPCVRTYGRGRVIYKRCRSCQVNCRTCTRRVGSNCNDRQWFCFQTNLTNGFTAF